MGVAVEVEQAVMQREAPGEQQIKKYAERYYKQ
jgi:hypothetical protein